jgi:hypothetical protein
MPRRLPFRRRSDYWVSNQKLIGVFSTFDLDGSGSIDASELMQLGKARRSLGQKTGAWTNDRNACLVHKMDANKDGVISGPEFAKHFDVALPKDQNEFDMIITQFLEVAKTCRLSKQQKRAEREKQLEQKIAKLLAQLDGKAERDAKEVARIYQESCP